MLLFKENEIIMKIAVPDLYDEITLINCIIDRMTLNGNDHSKKIIIQDCIIREFTAVGTGWLGGCSISGCIFRDIASFEAGGHNKEIVCIENNVFLKFVNFFDAQFEGKFIFKNNILLGGSDLLGNNGQNIQTILGSAPEIVGNIGELCLDG